MFRNFVKKKPAYMYNVFAPYQRSNVSNARHNPNNCFRYLHQNRREQNSIAARRAAGGAGGEQLTLSRSIEHLIGADNNKEGVETMEAGAENCYSVLVETGVFSTDTKHTVTLEHSPRDFLPVQESFSEPTHTVKNVYEAVDLIFKQEKYT